MKVDILTFHRAYNYGAVLQAYALAKSINDLGTECEVLDYWPEIFKKDYYHKIEFNLLKPHIRTRLEKTKISGVLNPRNRNFEKFLKHHVPLSKKTYHSQHALNKSSIGCDRYITGSDQVWHNLWAEFDPVFFLDFADAKNKPRYSYAASFGFKEVPEDLKKEYAKRLSGYTAYSVREDSGRQIIKGLIGKEAVVSCDPTLLLPASHWNELCCVDLEKEPYILVYYTNTSRDLNEAAVALSKKTGYKVISIPCNLYMWVINGDFDKPYGFDTRSTVGPKEFLSLIKNAKYVLTNSFHGTVFSIIFHKQFLTKMISDNGAQNSRAAELFDVLNIKNRDLENNFENIEEMLDWQSVDKALIDYRKTSIEYLKSIIK